MLIQKKCSICKLPKSLKDDFNKKKTSPDGKQPHCKECGRQRSREYYAANREKHIKICGLRKQETKDSNYQWLREYLSTHSRIFINTFLC
jgi:hypothetical protein